MAKNAEDRYQSTLRPDRRPRALPRELAQRRRGRGLRARPARRLAPLPDPAEALRPRGRARSSCRALFDSVVRGRDRAVPGDRLLRRRQVRAGQRDRQADRAAQHGYMIQGKFDQFQREHRLRRDRRRVPRPDAAAAERARATALDAWRERLQEALGAERAVDRRAGAGARADHRRRSRRSPELPADRGAEPLPDRLLSFVKRVRQRRAAAGDLPGRPAVERRRRRSNLIALAGHGARAAHLLRGRRLPQQRGRRRPSARA